MAATIKALSEAENLSNFVLLQGVMETIFDRGNKVVGNAIPAKPFQGTDYKFNREKTIAAGSSLIDKRSTDPLPQGVGTTVRKTVDIKAMGRDADTAKVDVIGLSNINDQRTQDVMSVAKKIGFDFVNQFFHGMGIDNQMNGLDYWVEDAVVDGFAEQDYNAGAALSYETLLEFTTRSKGEPYDIVYCDRTTHNAILGILAALPGNTAYMFADEKFGMDVLRYNNTTYLIADAVDKDKVIAGGKGTLTGTTFEVTSVDNGFVGFSSRDVGKTITNSGNATTIATVVSSTEITIASATGWNAANATTVTANPLVMYGVRFDASDGVGWLYYNNEVPVNAKATAAPMGDYLGAVAGFSARDLGELQEGGIVYRTRLDVFGNFVSHDPRGIGRMWGYTLP